MTYLKKFILFSIIILSITACASKKSAMDKTGYYKVGNPYKVDDKLYVPKEQPEYDEVGMSSWYGSDFHGKKTANGAIYDKNSLTAAHNTLPLPSMVRVTNLENNKTIILMVNDRGPFSKKRIIDVSEKAAEILGYKQKGIAKVRVQFLKGQTKRLLAEQGKEPGSKFKMPFFSTDPETDTEEVKNENAPIAIASAETLSQAPKKLVAGAAGTIKTAPAWVEPVEDVKLGNPTPPKGEIDAIEVRPEIKAENQQVILPKKVKPTKLAKAKNKTAKKQPEFIETEDGTAQIIDEEKAAVPAKAAAKTKDFAEVEKVVIPAAPSAEAIPVENAEQHFIQAGTFSVKENAERASKSMRALGDVAIKPVKIGDKTMYRVRLGPILDPQIAKLSLEKVIKLGHPDAKIIDGNG
jgi:rare lipoprotein A